LRSAGGEAILDRQVIHIFPAGALRPVQLDHDDGYISGI
jgi:hypothetical protein